MKILAMICVLSTLLLAIGSARADISNGSFETGDFTGWNITSSSGMAGVVTSHADTTGGGTGTTSWSPTDGSYFALLTDGTAETHVQLYQSFYAPAGDTLTFDYFWDSGDYKTFTDTGTGKLLSGSGTDGSVISTLFSHSIYGGSNEDPLNYWGTPWTSVNYYFASEGTYTLLIETWNGGDSDMPSYVGIDNVALSSDFNPVPIPGAFLLGILGLGAAGLKLRRFV